MAAVLALASFVAGIVLLVGVVDGLRSGEMEIPGRGRSWIAHRKENPGWFWFSIAFYGGFGSLVTYFGYWLASAIVHEKWLNKWDISLELETAKKNLAQMRNHLRDEHPLVKQQRQKIAELEEDLALQNEKKA